LVFNRASQCNAPKETTTGSADWFRTCRYGGGQVPAGLVAPNRE
jgi:hypothetical protein